MTETVGLIGLGLLGSAIASRLLSAGTTVIGFDIHAAPRGQFASAGGRLVDSVEDVADSCRCIILCLPDSRIVAAVLHQLLPRLQSGDLVIDTTTGDPDSTVAQADRLAAQGVELIDVTVLGSSDQMRSGSALLLAGGATETLDRCTGLLGQLSESVHRTGAVGSGQRMKLVANLALGLNRAVLAETLAFAQSLQLDLHAVLRVLQSGAAYSRVMDTKGARMLAREFEPQARLSQHLKDVRLINGAAESAGRNLPLSQLHQSLLEQAERMGLGDLDNSAILRVWDH